MVHDHLRLGVGKEVAHASSLQGLNVVIGKMWLEYDTYTNCKKYRKLRSQSTSRRWTNLWQGFGFKHATPLLSGWGTGVQSETNDLRLRVTILWCNNLKVLVSMIYVLHALDTLPYRYHNSEAFSRRNGIRANAPSAQISAAYANVSATER